MLFTASYVNALPKANDVNINERQTTNRLVFSHFMVGSTYQGITYNTYFGDRSVLLESVKVLKIMMMTCFAPNL